MSFKLKVEQIKELPSLPNITKRLLQLQKKGDANTQQLTNIIEIDPILSTQILKYANSAFFNRSRQIESLTDAIHLIGFDNALNYALGITSASQFNVPLKGPIGMRSFWKHAIYSAHLMQKLANKVPIKDKPLPGLAYLSGLLHNFGFILLAHSFPNEFYEVNEALAKTDAGHTLSIEQTLLGVHHFELAIWLMRKWGLPKEIMSAVFEHHNEHYRGINWQYANLTLLADRALFDYKIGDAESNELPTRILSAFNLNENSIKECTEKLFEEKTSIDAMIEGILESINK
jgi:HD-like signal output (HDOD) protein